jgi:hypothetical protein
MKNFNLNIFTNKKELSSLSLPVLGEIIEKDSIESKIMTIEQLGLNLIFISLLLISLLIIILWFDTYLDKSNRSIFKKHNKLKIKFISIVITTITILLIKSTIILVFKIDILNLVDYPILSTLLILFTLTWKEFLFNNFGTLYDSIKHSFFSSLPTNDGPGEPSNSGISGPSNSGGSNNPGSPGNPSGQDNPGEPSSSGNGNQDNNTLLVNNPAYSLTADGKYTIKDPTNQSQYKDSETGLRRKGSHMPYVYNLTVALSDSIQDNPDKTLANQDKIKLDLNILDDTAKKYIEDWLSLEHPRRTGGRKWNSKTFRDELLERDRYYAKADRDGIDTSIRRGRGRGR